MRITDKPFYVCPVCGTSFEFFDVKEENGEIKKAGMVCKKEHTFSIADGIPDLTWPKELAEIDEGTRLTYEKLAAEYDKFASFPFQTFKSDESEVREQMTDRLAIKSDSKVLEVGAGDGRGAEHVARRLGKNGKFFIQELSPSFLKKSFKRLEKYNEIIGFSIGNASYIPFQDNTFDAAYHFGGISTFAEVKRCLSELCRVVKPGGKVLVGDESMGPWLRETDFGKIMMNSNPLFKYEIPLIDIPHEARDVKVEWIMMGAFFILEFTVGEGVPEANYHVPIPSERGGTHWTRYHGHLEGVSDETKKMAYEARAKLGIGMSEWLDQVIRDAAKKELGS